MKKVGSRAIQIENSKDILAWLVYTAMDKIIFVYNADSGLVNGLIDWAHKIVSPETYSCTCAR